MENNLVAVDTNIILRFLLNDSQKLSPQAKDYFAKAKNGSYKIYLDSVILAETVWVLSSVYKAEKNQIADQITGLVSQDWIVCPEKDLIVKAFSLFKNTHLSYIDCWVATICQKMKIKLETFDEKLKKTNRQC